MSREYLLGSRIVLLAVTVAAVLSFTLLYAKPTQTPAGRDLGEHGFPVGTFSLTERSGRTVTDADLADCVWIGSFIFTRCPLSCPKITSVMKGLQEKLAGSSAKLVSISVDPTYDTPEVLTRYAKSFGADPDRWWFLTGPRDLIYEMIEKRFKLNVSVASPEEAKEGAEAVVHSDRLILVDRGMIVGIYDSNDPEAISDLITKAKHRSLPSWVLTLPSVNATLNGLCAVLLLGGWVRIRGLRANEVKASAPAIVESGILADPHIRGHVYCMVAAVSTSAVFLACYLVYHFVAGSVKFQGGGMVRSLYFTILISHTLLATFGVVPLVTLTLLRAIRGDFHRHAAIARVTFPIWLYVSITGVLIYLMLYQLPVPTALVAADTVAVAQ